MYDTAMIATCLDPTLSLEDTAVVSFLVGYSGETRKMYTADLRIFFNWCEVNDVRPLEVSRMHLELFRNYLEEVRGNAPASVHRRLSTVKSFFRIAEFDGLVSRNPAVLVRLPHIDYDETRVLGIGRMELAKLIQVARASSPMNGALIGLMCMLGLRVSEACGINVEDCNREERGHHVIRFTGKGNKLATMPLAVPMQRILEEAVGERMTGPLITRRDGRRMDRHTAYRRVHTLARKAGLPETVHPHTLRHAAITAALDAGASLRTTQQFARHSDPRITMRYDTGRRNLDSHAGYLVASFISGAV